jgi:hypothetical protein
MALLPEAEREAFRARIETILRSRDLRAMGELLGKVGLYQVVREITRPDDARRPEEPEHILTVEELLAIVDAPDPFLAPNGRD